MAFSTSDLTLDYSQEKSRRCQAVHDMDEPINTKKVALQTRPPIVLRDAQIRD
jgi:hypothetical protein